MAFIYCRYKSNNMPMNFGFSGTPNTSLLGPGLNRGMTPLTIPKTIKHTGILSTVKGGVEVAAVVEVVVLVVVITVEFWQRFKSQYYYTYPFLLCSGHEKGRDTHHT
jgi:hypothetical protein